MLLISQGTTKTHSPYLWGWSWDRWVLLPLTSSNGDPYLSSLTPFSPSASCENYSSLGSLLLLTVTLSGLLYTVFLHKHPHPSTKMCYWFPRAQQIVLIVQLTFSTHSISAYFGSPVFCLHHCTNEIAGWQLSHYALLSQYALIWVDTHAIKRTYLINIHN